MWRLWDDIKESCLEVARAASILAREEHADMEVGRRAENRVV